MKSFLALAAFSITAVLFAPEAHAWSLFQKKPPCNTYSNANAVRCLGGYVYKCTLGGGGSFSPGYGSWKYQGKRCQVNQ